MGQTRFAESDHREEQLAAELRLTVERATALFNFYRAERRSGACPLVANERMHEFAKRLDAGQSVKIIDRAPEA